MDSVEIVRKFYNESVEAEWKRIAGRPEFLLTCRYIDRYIQPGDRVLDIGGGPGRYALHLAERGAEVTLLDLSEANIAFAAARAQEQGLKMKTLSGDARLAGHLVEGPFDHILLMGPLYHLTEESDRMKAMDAALCLLKPGGTLFASFISMSGGLIYAMKIDPSVVTNPNEIAFYTALTEGKSFAGMAFTQAYFVQPHEVVPFMERFPLDKLHFFGQESITSPCEDKIMSQAPELVAAWLDFAEKLCEREELLSWAEHLMYVGRKKE